MFKHVLRYNNFLFEIGVITGHDSGGGNSDWELESLLSKQFSRDVRFSEHVTLTMKQVKQKTMQK